MQSQSSELQADLELKRLRLCQNGFENGYPRVTPCHASRGSYMANVTVLSRSVTGVRENEIGWKTMNYTEYTRDTPLANQSPRSVTRRHRITFKMKVHRQAGHRLQSCETITCRFFSIRCG